MCSHGNIHLDHLHQSHQLFMNKKYFRASVSHDSHEVLVREQLLLSQRGKFKDFLIAEVLPQRTVFLKLSRSDAISSARRRLLV